MSEFDTAGSVEKIDGGHAPTDNRHPAPGQVIGWYTWADLDAFTQGYIEAAFSVLLPNKDGSPPIYPLSDFCGFRHLAPEALAKIVTDCDRFVKISADYWRPMCHVRPAGRDFWLVRQGGAGFGPGDWESDIGAKLCRLSRTFPHLTARAVHGCIHFDAAS
jgi:hypothetical protein